MKSRRARTGVVLIVLLAATCAMATPALGADTSFTNLDGTGGAADLADTGATVSDPDFPAVLKVPVPAGLPAVGGGSTTGSTLTCSTGSWAPDLLGSFLYRAPEAFSYAWTREGSPIPGATASTLAASSPGAYSCSVRASNAAGSAGPQTSAPFQVSTPPPPAPGTSPSQPSATKKCKKAKKRVAAAAKCKKKK